MDKVIVIKVQGKEQEDSAIMFKPDDMDTDNVVFACAHAAARAIAEVTEDKYEIDDQDLACAMIDGASQYIVNSIERAEKTGDFDGEECF